MTAPVISVAGLVKAFGDHVVLDGVSLDVARGELLGLVGPNGEGKSTLLRTLVGLVKATGGRVSVLGRDPATDGVGIRAHTSYLPGETGVYQQMTGEQFLRFCDGFYPRQQEALRRRLLDAFELPLRQRVRSYSAGMKQKLALIAALVPDVDLYVLDEPDRALDASVRFLLRDVLRALHDAGKTILLSSHHLREVETLANRLEFLLGGHFVPAARLEQARAQLRQRLRVRLRDGTAVPVGARVVKREPDGTMVVEPEVDPMAWLRTLPDGAVEKAEVGVIHLEDLYQLLLETRANGGGAP